MSRIFKLDIRESEEELEERLRKEMHVRKRERLQFLYWYKSGLATTRKDLGRLLNRSQFALARWIKTYQTMGLQGLLNLQYRGGNLAPSIPAEVREQLKARLSQPEGFDSYQAIQHWLKETHGLEHLITHNSAGRDEDFLSDGDTDGKFPNTL
jgi:putative transposase